jgi:hypothetical protein
MQSSSTGRFRAPCDSHVDQTWCKAPFGYWPEVSHWASGVPESDSAADADSRRRHALMRWCRRSRRAP